jgi:hypothetical protein
VTATPVPTETVTDATPTPTPYDGGVARFQIPRFKVDSAVESIGLLPGNQLDVPKDPHDTGWYDIYDRPGWKGNAVFAAHVDYYPDIRGPFYNLKNVVEGDAINIVMNDGEIYHYKVVRYKRYDADNIPMGDLIWPPDRPADAEWITLITCGGRFQPFSGNSGPGEYLDRDVVVAVRVS